MKKASAIILIAAGAAVAAAGVLALIDACLDRRDYC